MDGVEATKKIAAREDSKPKPLVIMLTAHVSDTFRTTCLESGASDYIAKPCTIEGLRKTLIKNLFWEMHEGPSFRYAAYSSVIQSL